MTPVPGETGDPEPPNRRFVLIPRRQGKAQASRDAVEIARKLGWDVDVAHPDGTVERLRKGKPRYPHDGNELLERIDALLGVPGSLVEPTPEET